jgi:hypothetical protein
MAHQIDHQAIIINLGSGQLETGFDSVNVRLQAAGKILWEDTCSLNPAPELQQLLQEWQLLYQAIVQLMGENLSSLASTVTFDDAAITNVSTQDLSQLHEQFRHKLNLWLAKSDFNRIEKKLRTWLPDSDRITVTILAEQQNIWQLPWYLWNFFDDYPQAIDLFSKQRAVDVTRQKPKRNGQVNIMAVFGEDPALQLQHDREDLQSILGTKHIEFIKNPSAATISANLTRELGCDIFWFGGHGDSTAEEGIIYLDHKTPLEISVLKQSFQTAVDRGLQIAVFNCCRGLGLADQLIDVNIPYIIVMRVEIPNFLAKQFLKDLLIQYRQGADFAQAFKFARHQLSLISPVKFANWLPILFHNPLSKSVTWQDLERSRARLPVPSAVVKWCRSITQPKSWLATGLGLGLVLSGVGCILKNQNSLLGLENNLMDRFQQIQADQFINQKSPVVMVNYDAMTVLGIVRPGFLADSINRVSEHAKPIAWGIGLAIATDDNSLTLDYPNIINCLSDPTNRQSWNYSLRQVNCKIDDQTSSLANELFSKYRKHHRLSSKVLWPDQMRLNPDFSSRIRSINLSEIRQLSPAQIKEIFDRKLVVIGIHNRDALALDRLLLTTAPNHALPILQPLSLPTDFLWILLWSTATTVVVWRMGTRSFISTTIVMIGSCIVVGGLLWTSGYGVPILVTVLSIGGAGVAIFGIHQIAGRIYPDLAKIYYQRGLAKARSGEQQGSIEDLGSAARLLGEQGRMSQAQRVTKKIEALKKDS